jgi:hypothetical protein
VITGAVILILALFVNWLLCKTTHIKPWSIGEDP